MNIRNQERDKFLFNNSKINVVDTNSIFNYYELPHNRYIILAENKEKYTTWQLPSSIDYILFDRQKEVKPNVVGKIKDSISFNRVKKEMLKQKLKTFIESKL